MVVLVRQTDGSRHHSVTTYLTGRKEVKRHTKFSLSVVPERVWVAKGQIYETI